MRNIAGKVMMDRNAPPPLLDTPQRGYDETKALKHYREYVRLAGATAEPRIVALLRKIDGPEPEPQKFIHTPPRPKKAS